ncbi:MAG TPA: YaiI/YqxD family protein [Halanaerobiales bacterium]|nr:YaiI/YqxD family protein [Halanaerobiales bacterium]
MRIIIDGDSCPVIDLTESIAKKFKIELILFCDYNHDIKLDYGKIIKVDQSYQSVDMKIINYTESNDIIVTNDYGLASIVLAKNTHAINANGKIYTERNIDTLLMKRHINKKIRRAGGKHPTAKKRQKKDDQKFKTNLIKLINKVK